jgi:hypothetical protein
MGEGRILHRQTTIMPKLVIKLNLKLSEILKRSRSSGKEIAQNL